MGPMSAYNNNVYEYINSLYTDFEGEIGELQRYGYDNNFPIIPKDTARFLSTIVSIKKPKSILEIGCCIGFSASLMANIIDEDGKVTTIERYNIMVEKAKDTFNRLNLGDKIILLEGDATDILKTLDEKYDLIFLDAAKSKYIHFLPDCLRLLNVGGVLIADNVLQKGDITKDIKDIEKRQRTIYRNMRDFLYTITHINGLETSIIPIGDGISISTKLKEIKSIGGNYE